MPRNLSSQNLSAARRNAGDENQHLPAHGWKPVGAVPPADQFAEATSLSDETREARSQAAPHREITDDTLVRVIPIGEDDDEGEAMPLLLVDFEEVYELTPFAIARLRQALASDGKYLLGGDVASNYGLSRVEVVRG